MKKRNSVTEEIRKAYELLLGDGSFRISKPLVPSTSENNAGAEFSFQVDIPQPNSAGISNRVTLRVLIPDTFPYSTISIFPVEEEIRGFPHQDAETGKLCLRPEHEAPCTEERLRYYILWAEEWLIEAAMGELLKDDDPYELPDFSRRNMSLPKWPLLFVESSTSFSRWNNRVGCSGSVHLSKIPNPAGLLADCFCFDDEAEDYRPPFRKSLLKTSFTLKGRWLILPEIRIINHRPAQNFSELCKLCRSCDINLEQELKKAWEIKNPSFDVNGKAFHTGAILVGFPIPELNGKPASEIHWQLLFVKNYHDAKIKYKPLDKKISKNNLFKHVYKNGELAPTAELRWGASLNVSSDRLYARGAHVLGIRKSTTALIGCGALGSAISELLVRGGLGNLALFDYDILYLNNLCRHTLDGRHTNQYKAYGLADRLASLNPMNSVTGFPFSLPLSSSTPKNESKPNEALLASDTLIDCTANESAFKWLSAFAKEKGKRLVSMFFNFDATILTLCISGTHTSCERVSKKLMNSVNEGHTPISADLYFQEPTRNELVIAGAGCWHPTFPALNNHIWMLAASAMDLLNIYLQKTPSCDGVGALIRRFPASDNNNCQIPLVEVSWVRLYR